MLSVDKILNNMRTKWNKKLLYNDKKTNMGIKVSKYSIFYLFALFFFFF